MFAFQFANARKCTGSANCKACTTCSSCKHCNSGGGTCGVCGGGETRSSSSTRGKNWLPWVIAIAAGGYIVTRILTKDKDTKK